MPRLKLTEEEARLVTRYREQCHAFNEGLAAAIIIVKDIDKDEVLKPGQADWICREIDKARKEHG